MAIYAIGDIQGCLDSLMQLLEACHFDQKNDQLWFTGDLVNRGPKSLETVRYIMSLGDSVISVLGNHDLHFLAVATGKVSIHKLSDEKRILSAPDLNEIINWLRFRPFVHYDKSLTYALVHAGIPPQWNLPQALSEARQVEHKLQSDNYLDLLENMYGNGPNEWHDSLDGIERHRYTINCFTRMRYCDDKGQLELNSKGSPDHSSGKHLPWFEHQSELNKNIKLLFGHWSTLGAKQIGSVYCLDSGCVWGGELTALKLGKNPSWIKVSCPEYVKP